jgi:hypothetical protein
VAPQSPRLASVAGDVALDLREPEFPDAFPELPTQCRQAALNGYAAVPEVAIDENGQAMCAKDYVRRAAHKLRVRIKIQGERAQGVCKPGFCGRARAPDCAQAA